MATFRGAEDVFARAYAPSDGTVRGMPPPGDILSVCDSLAGLLARSWETIGRGDPSETGTLAAYARGMNWRLRGDGTATNPGLYNQGLKEAIRSPLSRMQALLRYDTLYRSVALEMFRALENAIGSNLPAWKDSAGFSRGWRFTSAASAQYHPIDACLLRMNAMSGPGGSVAPAVAPPVPTAVTLPSGTLGGVADADAPAVVYTLVGSEDWQESLYSAPIVLPGLSGASNAWQLGGPAWTGLTGSDLPAGTTKLRFYRTTIGGQGSGVYSFDQDVPVSPGAPLPVVSIVNGDSQLRYDIRPPLWAQALVTPEAAALFACAYGTFPTTPGEQAGPVQYQASGMLSPTNVALIPDDQMLGVANPPSSGRFGQLKVNGDTAITFTPGAIQRTNAPGASIQGFAGAVALQGRVTQTLGGAGSCALDYYYCDALHGWGVTQQDTSGSAAFTGTEEGALVTWPIPAGRIVIAVGNISGASGFGSGGNFDVEAASPRAY